MPVSTITAFRVGLGRTRQLLRNARLHATAPDEFTLRGIKLRLDEPWVTPLLRGAIYDGWYEAPESAIVSTTMEPDDRVLEIGCGIGFITTLASKIVGDAVRCYDANPAMVDAARRTIERNQATAVVEAAALLPNPTGETVPFYLHQDFWESSLRPDPQAEEISVPVLDAAAVIASHRASYVIIDIEGGEADLLLEPLPECVRKLCLECHPVVTGPVAMNAMLGSLIVQGFTLSLEHSRAQVLYFNR